MHALAHQVLEPLRQELTAYVSKLVLRPSVAEEITQSTFLRALESEKALPEEPQRIRAWLFRVATNLAIDAGRRHADRREIGMSDLRVRAESDVSFLNASEAMIGTPETKAIAREHIIACFACALGRLPVQRAAALLLSEVHQFSNREVAVLIDATENQVKNWLQEARASMTAEFAGTCALVRKQGVCHQCSELKEFMRGDDLNSDQPLTIVARLALLRGAHDRSWNVWHKALFGLLDDLD